MLQSLSLVPSTSLLEGAPVGAGAVIKTKFFYGWIIVGVAFVCLGMAYVVMNGFSIFFVAILDEFGWERATTALAFSTFTVVYGLFSPVVGSAVDRFGPRVVIPIGSVILAGGLAACSMVSEAWHLYLAYGVLAAIGVNAVGTMVNMTVLTNWFSRRRGAAIGFASAGIGVGMLVLVPLLQYVIDTAGWRTAYIVLATIIIVTLPPLAIIFHRHRPEDMGLRPDGAPATEKVVDAAPVRQMRIVDEAWARRNWTVGSAIATRRFWFLFFGLLFGMVAMQSIMVHQVAYLTDRGFDPMLGATVVALVGIFGSVGKVFWGWLSDRLGREGAYTLGLACLVAGVLLLSGIADSSQVWPVYVYTLVFGFGYGVFAPMIPSSSADLFQGKHFGAILGFLYIGTGSGSALGPWASGLVFDLTGSYSWAFVMTITAAALSVAGFWLAGPRKVRQVPGMARRRQAEPVTRRGI